MPMKEQFYARKDIIIMGNEKTRFGFEIEKNVKKKCVVRGVFKLHKL